MGSAMNRHQLLACASAEMQTALKTYTHDDLPRTVTDTAAIDVLSALREGLRITTIHQLDALPPGALIRSAVVGTVGRFYEKFPNGWYEPGCTNPFPHHMRTTLLDALLLWHPTWATKGMK